MFTALLLQTEMCVNICRILAGVCLCLTATHSGLSRLRGPSDDLLLIHGRGIPRTIHSFLPTASQLGPGYVRSESDPGVSGLGLWPAQCRGRSQCLLGVLTRLHVSLGVGGTGPPRPRWMRDLCFGQKEAFIFIIHPPVTFYKPGYFHIVLRFSRL